MSIGEVSERSRIGEVTDRSDVSERERPSHVSDGYVRTRNELSIGEETQGAQHSSALLSLLVLSRAEVC
jgi:hypothetical protein